MLCRNARTPANLLLLKRHGDAHHLLPALRVEADGDQHGGVLNDLALAHLLVAGIQSRYGHLGRGR